MKTPFYFLAGLIVALVTVTTMAKAQTHPSENYPGKGGNMDSTNAAPGSPEEVNPSTGTQNTPPSHSK